MRRFITVVALLMYTSIFVLGQATSDEQTLKGIEQELLDALLKGDASVFERYLADGFIFTDPEGVVMNKTENIAPIKSRDLKFESSKFDDMKIKFYGPTAVVTYQTTDKGTFKGNEFSGQYRWIDVFVKQSKGWQIVATQGTRIAAK